MAPDDEVARLTHAIYREAFEAKVRATWERSPNAAAAQWNWARKESRRRATALLRDLDPST